MRFLQNIAFSFSLVIASNAYSNNLEKLINIYNYESIEKTYSFAKNHANNDVLKFLQTRLFLSKNYNPTFEEITKFLSENPVWPEYEALMIKAESKICSKTNLKKIYNWFSIHKPKTGTGYYYYYKSALKHEKNASQLLYIARDAWVYSEFNADETRDFLKRFSSNIDQNLHVRKIDNLLWKGKIDKARDLMPLVDNNYKIIYKAWINILEKKHSKEEILFHNIKGNFRYHSGLLHAYLKLHLKNKPNSELISLFVNSPIDIERSREWWKLRNYFSRELFNEGDYQNAYIIVSKHGLSDAADIAEAEWFAGWIALRYLNKPTRAINHFEKLYYISKYSHSKSRGAYWLGRSLSILNKKETSLKWYNIAANYGHTFYGQLAQKELGYEKLSLNKKQFYTNQDEKYYKLNKFVKIAEFLAKCKSYSYFGIYAKMAIDSARSDGEIYLIINKLSKDLPVHEAVRLSKLALHKNVFVERYSYPKIANLSSFHISKHVTLGIIRQESLFENKAISSAKAKGLMQVIPPTAITECKKLNIKYNDKEMLNNISYNIKIGTSYFHSLLEKFNHSYILSIAGYNAGPHNSMKWIQLNGDPTKMKLYQVIDWIESITFYETRTYVQRVVENIEVYRNLLDKNARLKIEEIILNKKI